MVWAAGARRRWRYNKEVRRKRENQRVRSAGAAVARAPTPALRSMTWTSFGSPEAYFPFTPTLLQNGGNVGIWPKYLTLTVALQEKKMHLSTIVEKNGQAPG